MSWALAATLLIGTLAGCSKIDTDDQKTPAPAEKNDAPAKSGVTIDAAMMGLKTESPAPMAWQPEMNGFGRVLMPATLAAAVADLESARATAEVSSNEYARQQILAAQANASVRALETAQADARRDALSLAAARTKFAMTWGQRLAKGDEAGLKSLISGETLLVQIDLPVRENLSSPPLTATVTVPDDASVFTSVDYFDTCVGVDEATQMQGYLYLAKASRLTPGLAVAAALKIARPLINGVVVPDSAVLRHEGAGWVYVQTATNQFVRTPISLDRRTTGGWFVSENLSVTNQIVITGAQTVLSTELSGGGFTTGERD
ncbi:MAG TPA: hypothetical protein VGO57_14900 [Verrucomicrobiae bacterium]|jgi:hypothetical protein